MLLSFAFLRLNEFDADASHAVSAQGHGRTPCTDGPRARTHPVLIRRRDADAFPNPSSPIIDLAQLPVADCFAAGSDPVRS